MLPMTAVPQRTALSHAFGALAAALVAVKEEVAYCSVCCNITDAGVDPLGRRDFWRRINALAESGITIMVTTHFMEEAEYCDRLVIMAQGQILAEGTSEEMRARFRSDALPNPTMEDAFVALIAAAQNQQVGNAA